MILHVLIARVAGWVQRHQQQVITYLIEENHVLKAHFRGRRLCLEAVSEAPLVALRGHALATNGATIAHRWTSAMQCVRGLTTQFVQLATLISHNALVIRASWLQQKGPPWAGYLLGQWFRHGTEDTQFSSVLGQQGHGSRRPLRLVRRMDHERGPLVRTCLHWR
jgi:hypothetical protein